MPAMPGEVIVLILLAFIVFRVSISVNDRRRRSRRVRRHTRTLAQPGVFFLVGVDETDRRNACCQCAAASGFALASLVADRGRRCRRQRSGRPKLLRPPRAHRRRFSPLSRSPDRWVLRIVLRWPPEAGNRLARQAA